MKPEHRTIGTESNLPLIVNGAWQMSEGHLLDSARDLETAGAAFLRLIEAGFTAFDGADIYTGVEELFGGVLRSYLERNPDGRREDLRFHTKFVPDQSMLGQVDRDYVRSIVRRSLSRIGTEYLDLVQFHWWDWEIDGFLRAAGWLEELRSEGLIRQLGVTNFDTSHLQQLLDEGIPIVSNQVQYSLLDRRPARSMTGLCLRTGLRLICYGALAGGFLTDSWLGKKDPGYGGSLGNRSLIKYRLIIDEFGGWDAFQTLLAFIRSMADRKHADIANIACAYVLGKPEVAAVIIGARNDSHLASTRVSASLRLSPEELREIDRFLESYPGPPGEPFELERVPGGVHRSIMKTDLNRN